MRRLIWILSVVPGLLFVAQGLNLRLEIWRRERLARDVDIYPLQGGRVRVIPRGASGLFQAVMADADRPEVDLPWEDAVKFSWRREDSGACEWGDAAVLEVRHHGKPLDLVYSGPPNVRAALRVYPSGRVEYNQRLREAESLQYLLAGLWLGPLALILALRLWSRRASLPAVAQSRARRGRSDHLGAKL